MTAPSSSFSPPQFTLHPSSASPSQSSTYNPPPPSFLPAGTWHVTHSTLPMWKTKRNVRITYTPLSPSPSPSTTSSSSTPAPKLDDLVRYTSGHPSPTNPTTKPKEKSVHGTSTPTPGKPGQFDWRGKGWLVVASSHWEVLGWGTAGTSTAGPGEEDGGEGGRGGSAAGVDWAVTYFAKTLFTPAGVDVYQRRARGEGERGEGEEEEEEDAQGSGLSLLGEKEMRGLREAMRRLGEEGDEEMKRLEPMLFEVGRE